MNPNIKELRVIFNALDHAQRSIEELCNENYPYTNFCDPDFRMMFYTLNDFCIRVSKKIDALKPAKEDN